LSKSNEIYLSCSNIRSGFNIFRDNKILPCCYARSDDFVITRFLGDSSFDEFDRILREVKIYQEGLIQKHKNGNIPNCCKSCVYLQKKHWNTDHFNFNFLILNHYKACNLKCKHCFYIEENKDLTKDTPQDIVMNFIEYCRSKGLFKINSYISLGGGEPSINRKLLSLFEYCLEYKISLEINSNGAKFLPIIADGINKGIFTLYLSPDVGSKELFFQLKGVDLFDITWSNIKKYVNQTNGKAFVKFIIQESNKDDIENMINMCLKTGVKNVNLSFDFNIKESKYKYYKSSIEKFVFLCHKNQICCDINTYVPNLLLASLKDEQKLQFEKVIHNASGYVYFWGASHFLEQFLDNYVVDHKKIRGIIDRDTQKIGNSINGIAIYAPSILTVQKCDTIIISVAHNHIEIKDSITKFLKENSIKINNIVIWN